MPPARACFAGAACERHGGLPDVYTNAWWDWYLNLAKQPPQQVQLVQDALAFG
jgi:hypothetical protein